MPMSPRKRFIIRATAGYALFASIWIFLSDQILASFGDVATVTHYATLKGLLFILVTAAMLWFTLQNVPGEAGTAPLSAQPPQVSATSLLWGVLAPSGALGLQWAFWVHMQPFAGMLFYPAVLVASWLGGWLAGTLAAALSGVMVWYFFIPPFQSWSTSQPAPIIALSTFLATGLLMSLVIESLRRSAQQSGHSKFAALVEQSLAGIYIAQDNRLRYVNPEFARIFGYDRPEQLVDQVPISALITPQDRAEVLARLATQAAHVGQKDRFTVTARRQDGVAIELDVHARSVMTETGPAVIGLTLDVTDQRRSEQLLRAVVEGTTDAVFVKDLAGHYLMANPAACTTLMGRPHDQVIGQHARTMFSAESCARIDASDRFVMAANVPLTQEDTLTRLDGVTHTYLMTKGPMRDASGQVSGLFGISHDISGLIEAQAALRDKQALLDRMSALAKVGGWSLDPSTLEGTRTQEAAHILDLDLSDPASLRTTNGLRFFEGVHLERITQAMQRAVKTGEPYALELELISDKGVRKWIRSHGEPIWQDGRVVRIEGAIQDISEVQQARLALQAHQAHLEQTVRERTAELEAARQEAERLMRIKSEFLANMSHEIRTPLNGVLGLAQIGQRDHAGSARHIFTQILDSGHLLLGIINDILDFSKIEAGQLKLESLPVNLQALLTRVTAPLQARAQAKAITLAVQVSEALPATCLSDPLRLEQILLNLLSNAVKFTAQGQVSVSADAHEGQLRLRVTDTGIGMSAPQVNELFRPFAQGDGSTTRRYGGTGLGLSITRRLVELLGGTIQVDSQPGQGSRFEVLLPLVQPPADVPAPVVAEAPAAPPDPVHRPRLAGVRVLAAEDNLVNQIVLQECLKMEGALVTLVDDGQAAVDQVAQQGAQAFDVALMDIQMPRMDGYEATRHIKALAPDLPVIGQTAHAMLEERLKCLEAGMVDLVVKPLDLNQLIQTIGRHARRPADSA